MPSKRAKAQELRRQMNEMSLEELWPLRKSKAYTKIVSKKVKGIALCSISRRWHPLNGLEIEYIKNAAGRFFAKHKNKPLRSFLKLFTVLIDKVLDHLRLHI